MAVTTSALKSRYRKLMDHIRQSVFADESIPFINMTSFERFVSSEEIFDEFKPPVIVFEIDGFHDVSEATPESRANRQSAIANEIGQKLLEVCPQKICKKTYEIMGTSELVIREVISYLLDDDVDPLIHVELDFTIDGVTSKILKDPWRTQFSVTIDTNFDIVHKKRRNSKSPWLEPVEYAARYGDN